MASRSRHRGTASWPSPAFTPSVLPFAPSSAQTLNIGVGTPATAIAPHYRSSGTNNALTMPIFGRLVERGGRARPRPGLARP